MAQQPRAVDLRWLVAEHHAELYRYAFRLSGSVWDAEDLTQQTFLSAHERMDQLREPRHARAWLFAILRNGYLKSRQRRLPLALADAGVEIHDLVDDFVEASWLDREHVQAALDRLAPDFKLVLMQFYFEGLSYRQIAESSDLPLGTVMSRLSRAKGQLRAFLLEAESGAWAARSSAEIEPKAVH